MRMRTTSGLAAGALVGGLLVAPFMAGTAQAAVSNLALDGNFECQGSTMGFTMGFDVTGGIAVSADGASVTASTPDLERVYMLKDGAKADLPGGFLFEGLDLTLNTKLNGETVALQTSVPNAPGAGANAALPIALPTFAGSRELTSDLRGGVIQGGAGVVEIFVPYGNETFAVDFTCVGTGVEIAAPVLEARAFGATLAYDPAFAATQLDQAVTIKSAAFPVFAGPPPSVTVKKVATTAVFDLNGAEVIGTGTTSARFAEVPMTSGFAMPDIKVDLPWGAPAGELKLKSLKVVLTSTSDSALDFAVVSQVKVPFTAVSDPALVAKYSTFALGVGDGFAVAQDGTDLSLSIDDFPALPGIPAMVTVSNVELNAVFTHGDTEIPFTGTSVIEPATPMAQGFAFPALKGSLPVGIPAGELKLKEISAVVTAFGSPTPIAIDILRPLTVAFDSTIKTTETTVTATSPAANTVTIAASAIPATDGTFEVREGDKVVATQAAVAGKAAFTLTGVAKGKHSYTVTFVPSSSEFANSTVNVPAITVADKTVAKPPVVKASSTAKVSKVTYSKKTKKAKVSVKVTGKKAKPTGKVTITIKKGKKVFGKKTVTLKRGKASWTSKKLTKKGTYKVTVKYAGSKSYKASKTSKVKKFKIKK